MMKLFRKYMKHLLVVSMTLLLIIWLGGQALTSMFDRNEGYRDVVIGQAFGQPVRTEDLVRTGNTTQIGSALIPNWSMPWVNILGRAVDDPQLRQQLQMAGPGPLSEEEWYLLDREAVRNKVYVSPEAVSQVRSGIPGQALDNFREQRKVSMRAIDEALRTYLRVEEAAMRAAGAVSVSEADIRDFIRDIGEKVKVDMVVVDPQKLIDESYQPTDEQIQAQFAKYKDQPAAGPGEPGYQLPEATQVEFIEINVDELAKMQQVSDDEAFNYWQANKAQFKRPTTQPATTAPATRPEQPKPYETFTEARPEVLEKLQHDRAVLAANRLADDLVRQLSRPWANQPTTQPGGFKEPPAGQTAEGVYEQMIAAYETRYPGVLSYGRTQLGSAEELSSNPKIGRARAYAGTQQSVPFSQAAFMVAGLQAAETEGAAPIRLLRNVYETAAEPVSDTTGNVFVFRNLATRPAQAPASVDEVRDKVIADLRRQRAVEQAEEIAQRLAEQARQSNLKAAFQSDAELATKLGNDALVQPEPFSRQTMWPGRQGGMPQFIGGWIPGVGYDPELVDQAMKLAERTTETQPAPVATHQDNRDRWIVLEYQRKLPVTQQEYEENREVARQVLLHQKRFSFILDWFSPESIQSRVNWQPVEPEASPVEDQSQAAAS